MYFPRNEYFFDDTTIYRRNLFMTDNTPCSIEETFLYDLPVILKQCF